MKFTIELIQSRFLASMSQPFEEVPSWFNSVWLALEELGYCDDLGGMQYQRIYREWIAQHIKSIEAFIKKNANELPGDFLPSEGPDSGVDFSKN